MAGADPTDAETFPDRVLPKLRAAVDELSWLLARGYADGAASTLVGDHHQLTKRQRLAVRRCACPEERRLERIGRRVAALRGQAAAVDTLNQLVTTERGLAGGAVLRGRDGALRDVAGVHGTWRSSANTEAALARLGAALGDSDAIWVIDAPVSNSRRLAEAVRALAGERRWTVELVDAADGRLLDLGRAGRIVATSDAGLLDWGLGWFPLVEVALAADARIVDLG